MNIEQIINTLGFIGIKTVPFTIGKLFILIPWKEIVSLILTIEKMMQDGIIDASERKELANKGLRIILKQINIDIGENDLGNIIDGIVSLLNIFNLLKHKK